MLRVTLRDLQYRARRFAVTTLATAVVFGTVLLIAGLSGQVPAEAERTIRRFGADRWVVVDGDAGPFTGAGMLPAALASDLLRAGAGAAGPLLITAPSVRIGGRRQTAFVVGHDPAGLGAPRLVAGSAVRGSGELVTTVESGVRVGDAVRITGTPFAVVGLTTGMTMSGGIPFLFLHIADAQRLFVDGQPLANAVLVRGPPRLPPGYRPLTPDQTWRDALLPLRPVLTSLRYAALFLWAAGTALMAGVAYLSALDRLRDFAVLKALGGATGGLLAGLIVETLLLAAFAGVLGAGLAALVLPYFPIRIQISGWAYAQLAGLATGAGLLASLGGVRRAAAVDPGLAFSPMP